jgi:hypothetical protein
MRKICLHVSSAGTYTLPRLFLQRGAVYHVKYVCFVGQCAVSAVSLWTCSDVTGCRMNRLTRRQPNPFSAPICSTQLLLSRRNQPLRSRSDKFGPCSHNLSPIIRDVRLSANNPNSGHPFGCARARGSTRLAVCHAVIHCIHNLLD